MHQGIAYLLAIIVLFSILGCSEPDQAINETHSETVVETALQTPESDNRTAAEIVASAKTLQEEAIQLGHAWRTTSDHINEADKLLTSGEVSSARNAAMRAELSANASIAQAHSEQSDWQDRFPK